ncbi:hypothetical protein JOE57_002846 [Microlunatus panaciterrae]|uniref:Uncharacterized protein n=1 Tax=Microlunatus panaciterrae TaxID=400768 RepID=A0ABS2RLP5_9ACTN|nr:hypothetical protein [Microlunatus panaciterrae]MBM7799925.1 hypothetical protein [Microlunatus panaciterrae]
MTGRWISQPDGSLLARGRFVCVEIRQARGSFLVVSGGSLRGERHDTIESAKKSGIMWLALLDDLHRPGDR